MPFQLRSKKFVITYLTYVLLSFLLYLIVSNTIAAWLIYFVFLGPFYLLCIAHVISIALTKRNRIVRLHQPSLIFLLVVQGLMMLSSPASCYGWKQGAACYSLIQSIVITLFTDENLESFTIKVPHWNFIESAFLILVGLYIVAMILFLTMLRFDPPSSSPG